MSVAIQVKLEGANKLMAALSGMPDTLRAALGTILSKAAFLIEGKAKQFSPVDTGRLRASIFSFARSLYSEVSTNTDYAIYVHEGTKFMRARPFMRLGAEAAADDINDVAENEIERALNKVIK